MVAAQNALDVDRCTGEPCLSIGSRSLPNFLHESSCFLQLFVTFKIALPQNFFNKSWTVAGVQASAKPFQFPDGYKP